MCEYLLHAEGEKRELFFRRNKIFFYGKTQREFSYLTSEASLVSEFKLSFAEKKIVESKKVHVEHCFHATCNFVPHFSHFETRVCLDRGNSICRSFVNNSHNAVPVSRSRAFQLDKYRKKSEESLIWLGLIVTLNCKNGSKFGF